MSSSSNFPLAVGTFTGNSTRPDGEFGASAYAGDSGPTSVSTTEGDFSGTYTLHAPLAAPVPLPGALWLLGAGLAGLAAMRRRTV